MQIRPSIVLQAVLKSLTDNVLPALDPDNRLAQEQAQLIVGLLSLLHERMPLQFTYDLDELCRLVGLAQDLDAVDPALRGATDGAADTLARAGAAPEELISAIGRLRAAIGSRVSTLYAGADEIERARVNSLVLAASREQHLRERAWLIAQGWETDPSKVPPIEQLLAVGAERGRT